MGGTVYPARFHCPNNRHLPLPPPAAGGQKEDDFLMEHNIPELVAQLTLEEKADTIQSHSRFAVQPRIMDIYMEEKAVDA